MTINIQFGDTLVSASAISAAGSEDMSFASHRKATPFLAISFALAEQIVFASHLGVGKSATWTAVRLGVADTVPLTVARFHADSVLFTMADVQIKVALSSKGEVIGGRHMGQDWLVERKTVR